MGLVKSIFKQLMEFKKGLIAPKENEIANLINALSSLDHFLSNLISLTKNSDNKLTQKQTKFLLRNLLDKNEIKLIEVLIDQNLLRRILLVS